MPYYLPSSSEMNDERASEGAKVQRNGDDFVDLRIFWGPEICRLEYLLHLLETGRIVDEFQTAQA